MRPLTDRFRVSREKLAFIVDSTAAPVAGFLAAALGAFAAGIGGEVLRAAWTTPRAMWIAFAILYLAWMIGAACADVGTAPYLTALVGDTLDAQLSLTSGALLLVLLLFLRGQWNEPAGEPG